MCAPSSGGYSKFGWIPGTIVATLLAFPASPSYAGVEMCYGKPVTIEGTGAGEVIPGTPGNDVILAKGGNDTINAGAGKDTVCAGARQRRRERR